MEKKTNLSDRDNFSTRDKCYYPKMFFAQRFHCRILLAPMIALPFATLITSVLHWR